MTHRTHATVGLLLLLAATPLQAQATAQQAAGWISLFDGTSTTAWRGYNKSELPAGWQVVEGALTRVAEGGDIITRDKYDNFELSLEWKIAKGSNSGIFFHVVEDTARAMYMSGPELQVLDNTVHQDGLEPRTSAGSNYALHAPVRAVTKPAGEWNQTRIIVSGSHVEHWLNGVKVVAYELWSDDWQQRVAASKFKAWPGYGLAKTGHIGLQDHGDWVAYRNIRIRAINRSYK